MKNCKTTFALALTSIILVGCNNEDTKTQTVSDGTFSTPSTSIPPVVNPSIIDDPSVPVEPLPPVVAKNQCTGEIFSEVALLSSVADPAQLAAPALPKLVPLPVAGYIAKTQAVSLNASTIILSEGSDARLPDVVEYLREKLGTSTGFNLPVNPEHADEQPCIKLEIREADSTNASAKSDEAYSLIAADKGVVIRAGSAAGLFNGVQTLLQLMPPKVYAQSKQVADWTVEPATIIDWPRFGLRASMLDVARRFYTVDEVKRYIDQIAQLKINTLHMHLTDDQGWRIAITALPELTRIGGQTQSGFPARPENQWFYTREQYKDIVDYAASRFITIIPEIDGPGHTLAAKASIANLNCNNQKTSPYSGFDVGNPTICLDNEVGIVNSKAYLDTVLKSVAELTPGPYIHIGGDEAPGMTEAKMSAYVEGAAAPLAATKKTVMGWHQIAQGRLPAGTVLQYWGTDGNAATIGTSKEDVEIQHVRSGIRQGAKFIISPADYSYLDMKYDAQTSYGLRWASLVSVQRSYSWDPTTILASADKKTVLLQEKDIVGVSAPLWADRAFSNSLSPQLPTGPSERFIPPSVYTDYMAFPRLASISEIAWSSKTGRNWLEFKTRLAFQGPRWDAYGTKFFVSPEIEWQRSGQQVVLD